MATLSVWHGGPRELLTENADHLRSCVDSRLRELLPAVPANGSPVLFNAAAGALLGQGKRVRPIMTLLACAHVGGRLSDALDVGCAVEMVHAASLVLDDLPCMDNAALRRGAPTIHTTHGEDAAILAAIALLNQAYATVLAAESVQPDTRLSIMRGLTAAIGFEGLSQGQMRDLRDPPARRDEAGLRQLNHQKTSALFVSALVSGGAIGGATDDQARSLAAFGEAIGFAFQLHDDLIDATAPASQTGKDERQDADKLTFLDLWGKPQLQYAIDQSLARARAAVGRDCALSRYVDGLLRNAGLER